MLRRVSLILPSALQSIQKCQVCPKLRLTVKVRWRIIARSIDTHVFLQWRLLSIELVTVWRGVDSLRGFGGKEGPLMTEIHIFLFSFFPPNRSDKQWQLHNRRPYTCLGGREGPLMVEIYIFCFPILFSKHEWHLCMKKTLVSTMSS